MRQLILVVLVCSFAQTLAAQPRLGLAGTEPETGGYDAVLAQFDALDITATSLTVFWDEFDIGGTYDPAFDWPTIANAVYPDRGIALTLTIPVIDTVTDRRPEDLRALAWDHPDVIARFTAFIDQVLARMPDVEILTLAIGNEVDGVLRSNSDWQRYGSFFHLARTHVQTNHPDLPVGMTMTWQGLRESGLARAIANLGDGWFVNWYPLDEGFAVAAPETFAPTLALMRQMAEDRPLYLTEAGAPSAGCNSSEAVQTQFVQTILAAEGIELAMFVWMHDIPAPQVQTYQGYYGVDDPCFAQFLGSLGLFNADGTPKPAALTLQQR